MTARVVVMMTPGEKKALVSRAKEFELTPSELVRRASQTYGAHVDEAALEMLAEQLERSTAELKVQMTDVLGRVDARRAELIRLRAEHASV